MVIIKEDYCSREIYRLLIEKGFDGEVHTTFNEESYTQASITLQTAMEWLREKHKLCIVITPIVTDDDGSAGCLWEFIISKHLEIKCKSTYEYELYETACEAAIKHCLENLI